MNKFKLLIKNPILDSYTKFSFKDNYINNILDYNFAIPKLENRPFIFSCYALSIDGKLYYPDVKSGFLIAKSNYHASEIERYADWFILMLARTISDAVIVGTNSLNYETEDCFTDVLDTKLYEIRVKYINSKQPATFVFCRDLTNINFESKLFSDNSHQIVICCINNQINLARLPNAYKQINLTDWTQKEQLNLKNLILVDNWDMFILKLNKVGFNIILNESPYFHHKLLQLRLLDEIWLNYSGSYIGGNLNGLGRDQNPFNSKDHPDCEILTLHSLGYNFLYTRQKILYS